ncbi:hypothetical protein C2845_PM15G13840 [Panicum miliaceum]|uniref:DUF1618 domain-containing protein n=1 Tax=Panicum miliaceum TaxID=4540 RepID=A0A3L6Q7F8_PANMI|nr:hypothetical protein C2845_PM15G13840 [Panicum miliaceum]
MEQELVRHRAEAEIAFLELRRRKAASRPSATAVRKEPITFACDSDERAAYFADMLEGTKPFLSEVADAPGVTRFSIKYAWPPSRPQRDYPGYASIASCHRSLFLVCLGNCSPGGCAPCSFRQPEPGFYMVYNTRANSAAIVPPVLDGVSFRGRPTNKATLFLWDSRAASGKWIPEEVVVLPVPADEEAADTTSTTSFLAVMELALAADNSTSLCWVDLLTGVLVYKRTAAAYAEAGQFSQQHGSSFHFIPLPEGCDAPTKLRGGRMIEPKWYRSMCCVNSETALKFVSMEGYNQEVPMADVKLSAWILEHPLSPTRWKWHLSQSVRIGDLWHNPLYNGLKLIPCSPVTSTQQQHVVYLSVINYDYNREFELMEASELYILGIDMNLRGVVSSFKAPDENDGGIPELMRIFTSDFTSYLDKTGVDLYKVCPRGEEVADDGESRSNPAAWASVWISAKPPVEVSTNPRVGVSPGPGVGDPNLLDNPRRLGGHASSASLGGWALLVTTRLYPLQLKRLFRRAERDTDPPSSCLYKYMV